MRFMKKNLPKKGIFLLLLLFELAKERKFGF